MREQQVANSQICGPKLYVQLGFIEATVFSVYFKMPHTSLSCIREVTVWGPENNWLTGTLLQLPLLGNLPHYKCEVFSITQKALDTIVLPASKVHREGQAQDRFKLACSNMLKDRSSTAVQLRTANFPKVSRIEQVYV